MLKFLLLIPFTLFAVEDLSYAEANLKNYNMGTAFLLEGKPEEALIYYGEVSLKNRAPYLLKPLSVNSRIALLQAAKKLEGNVLSEVYNQIARKIGSQVKEFPEAFYLLQESKMVEEVDNPYKSTRFVIQAKNAAEKALLALKLARGVKLLKIIPDELVNEVLGFILKSTENAQTFLTQWQKDELAAYQARLCLESISSKVRPLIVEAINALEDANSLLTEDPFRFMVPQSLIEEAIFHFEQVLKLTKTLPEEQKPEEQKSAEQKVVEMELQDRVERQKVRVSDEVERPW